MFFCVCSVNPTLTFLCSLYCIIVLFFMSTLTFCCNFSIYGTIVLHRHFLPCVHPSYTLVLHIIDGLMALNNARVTTLLMYFWPFSRIWHRTPVQSVHVCVHQHMCFPAHWKCKHTWSTRADSFIFTCTVLYNTKDTEAPFAVSTHTHTHCWHMHTKLIWPNKTTHKYCLYMCECAHLSVCVSLCVLLAPTCATCSRGKNWVCFSDWGVSIQTYELIDRGKGWWMGKGVEWMVRGMERRRDKVLKREKNPCWRKGKALFLYSYNVICNL